MRRKLETPAMWSIKRISKQEVGKKEKKRRDSSIAIFRKKKKPMRSRKWNVWDISSGTKN